MTARGAKVAAIVSVCAAVALASVGAVLFFVPRTSAIFQKTLGHFSSGKVGQAEIEVVLQRVAKRLEPELRTKLAQAVLTESERAGYDPLFILGLVSVESAFRPHVSSERGAYGLMQLKPSTFAWIAGRNPDIGDGAAVSEDPVIDVRLAIRYFGWLERRFPRRDEALMAYNAGPGRLRHYKRVGIPAAVRAYPRKVMREYERFARLAGRQDPRDVMLARAN
jgi:soluble lytic murein transglycosylase-like protein